MATVIKVANLSKQFNDIKAVDNLSFSVEAGDVYGFLGQNGAGKSTTIRMLLTLIAPSSGTIEIFGMDLRHHRKEILRKTGAVIERPDLYHYLTAYENVALFAKMGGIRPGRSKLMDQLEQVGLAERAHHLVKTFSQGMKQRLGIAVALVHDPQLLVLDEPVNGLDPQGIADIRNLILRVSRELKKTVLVSSHLLSEIELIANRMLIIDKGKKIVEGAMQDLFDLNEMVVEMAVLNEAEAAKWIQHSKWHSFLTAHQHGKFIFRIAQNSIPLLTADLVQNGIEIVMIQPRHSLEDYFISLTSGNQHVAAFAN